MDEPSLLDLLKTKLDLHRLFSREEKSPAEQPPSNPPEEKKQKREFFLAKLPWRSLLAFFFALTAQRFFEPPEPTAKIGVFFYICSACMLFYALLKHEWQIQSLRLSSEKNFNDNIKRGGLIFFIPLVILSFFSFSENTFSALNIFLWVATFAAGLITFWVPEKKIDWKGHWQKLKEFIDHPVISFRIDYWKILVLLAFLTAVWFHFYNLDTIPLNMTSDHTEKLLDVQNILNGQYSIFFPNNGGREPIHFYLVAMLVTIFNASMSFFTLKLAVTLVFLLSLIYVYRLGNEIGSRWTGLFAMLLLGFSSWGNMITRVGLRLVLTPLFVAPVLFYFFRGIRLARRNDFIIAGILLGLGLMGYSAFRIFPLVMVVGVLIYLVYQKFNKSSLRFLGGFGLLVLFALVGALPLLRFTTEYPNLIGYRTITRMTSAEVQMQGSILNVFLSNCWNAFTMPFWKDGHTWVISVTDRPALDIYSAAMYFLGILLMLYRWIRSRSWQDLFLLISIPLLMMPSILSLAFPDENPSLSRAGGALIPIFLACALGFETFLKSLWARTRNWFPRVLVILIGLGVVYFSAGQNYAIALVEYPALYNNATWNTTEMGQVARDFIDTTGEEDNVWVVGVPYWADTRLVAMNAGYTNKDYAIWPKDLETTLPSTGAKLFIVKFDDLEGMERLVTIYPTGFPIYHSSSVAGRDFIAYFVPPGENQ